MTSVSSPSLADREIELSFDSGDVSVDPTRKVSSLRSAYHYLVNIDEYPEVVPLAQDVVCGHIHAVSTSSDELLGKLGAFQGDDAKNLPNIVAYLGALSEEYARPWEKVSSSNAVEHFFRQYTPTALVDGCWLRGGVRVPLAHTNVGARLTHLYAHTVRPHEACGHYTKAYHELFQRIGGSLEAVTSRGFVERQDFFDFGFELPVLLLSLGQLPRAYLPELLGFNLAWHYLVNAPLGAVLLSEVSIANTLPHPDQGRVDPIYVQKGQALALEAVEIFLQEHAGTDRLGLWERVWRGVAIGMRVWSRWVDSARNTSHLAAPDPRKAVCDLLRRKAPHAFGYHKGRKLGTRRIDEWLDPENFDPAPLLDMLATSRFVVPGQPDKSPFLRDLVQFGGPMVGVFSDVELQTIRDWINCLPLPDEARGKTSPSSSSKPLTGVVGKESMSMEHRAWSHASFRERSRTRYEGCSVRDLYYYLVNVELFPDILPVAERYVRDRLERAECTMRSGERPLPSMHYHPDALESWVYTQHRQQVDSYRPFEGAPRQSKEEFIESATQLAPLILIDGSWLQNITNVGVIHTAVGGALFQILFDEVGVGDARHHHANLYRELLAEMGGAIPPFDSLDFAHWSGFDDSSFDVPTFWLAVACFPRLFLPEILGLNLAVELAGIGGPYLEAYDTLKFYGFNTWFVEVHNAADNVSVGHTASAMNAIKAYMDDIATREGRQNLDRAWLRVWTGVRSTLPQCGFVRVLAHRIASRLSGRPLLHSHI